MLSISMSYYTRPPHTILRYIAVAAVLALNAPAQTPPSTILTVEMENVVQYQENFATLGKNGTSATLESPISPSTFSPGYFIGDIATVNGKKSKGTTVARNLYFNLNINPSGNQAIADINRFQPMEIAMEIQNADGTGLGTLVLTGLTGGQPPLGAPKSAPTGNFAVIGGTGAFVGARGQAATISNTFRPTSTLENPINRRVYPSGIWKMAIQLIPLKTPEVVLLASGPALVHSADFTLVTAGSPARAGEIVTVFATGLGPTRPGVDPGQPFTASPVQLVSSPIEVLVNGKSAEVLYSGGYPNSVDNYKVNFRVPADAAAGPASIQLSAAWVVGAVAKIPIQ